MKKIDSYLFKNFIGLLAITFFIVLFIVVMQFVWLHVDDLVGKGVPLAILGRFFFYASLVSIPIALPLAILLAALMTFGNLGERLELLAMKTAGISLFRIMRSLLILISFIVIGAFFFSNNVIPLAQKKMWTLVFSFREKSPELEVPTGEFYSGVKGRNIYVRSKDAKKKALLDVMIYDFSQGFDNANVTTADTVRITSTEDKKYLVISMINGECFENLKKQAKKEDNIPYRREVFDTKQILIEFDANFKEYDESLMANQHVSKNIQKLTHDIDSVSVLRDSLKKTYADNLWQNKLFDKQHIGNIDLLANELDTKENNKSAKNSYNIDTLFATSSQQTMKQIADFAVSKIQNIYSDVQYNTSVINEADYFYARHNVEWHLKFTLSFACLIFFFIGAPLGAIINKGGLGMPAVVSIALFIVYYIINTTGQKMAREHIWEVWQGMWLSSAVLLPIGIFLTYKAATDSVLFNSETYKKIISIATGFFKKITK
ncbi:MAG: LptF/LptG family permease [Prevotellaceae bacterium]|jgi:lipopolysaccharide export system permease protein|nr:LptF/LptG family permease [Prevotellaceae bacterium]